MTDPPRPRLSACMIVMDEERDLPAALESLAFCDEIVVVDSGSTDRTREIAAAAGARVVEQPWLGYAAQRNVAIDHATGDWILEVDADERITPDLAREIGAFLARPDLHGPHAIVVVPKRHRFLGGWLEGTMKYPGYHGRLFRRGSHRHDETRTVHEGLWPQTAAWVMHGDMTHELAHTLGQAVDDARSYSRLEAAQFHGAVTPRALAVGVVARPLAKLVFRLVVDRAIRDGWRGVLKVVLDCGGDALVWVLAARSARRRTSPSDPSDAADGHFSAAPPGTGPLRVVAVATDAGATRRAADWATDASAQGADVTVVSATPEAVAATPAYTDGPPVLPGTVVRVRALDGRGPLAIVRALDIERQVRPPDALLVTDARTRRLVDRIPEAYRGPSTPATPDEGPAAALRRIAEQARG